MNFNQHIPHYEDDPLRTRNQGSEGQMFGQPPRGRPRFMRWRGARGKRGRGGGLLPALESSFIQDNSDAQLTNASIPFSNQPRNFFHGPGLERGNVERLPHNPGDVRGSINWGVPNSGVPPADGFRMPHPNQLPIRPPPLQPPLSQQQSYIQHLPSVSQAPPQQPHTIASLRPTIEQHIPAQESAEQFLLSQEAVLTVASQASQIEDSSSGDTAQNSAPSAMGHQTSENQQITTEQTHDSSVPSAIIEIANQYNSKKEALRSSSVSIGPIEDRHSARQRKEAELQAAWDTLHQYWQFVQDNPYDFNGWTYLLSHVETMDSIDAARAAFDGFLPLYPYCFAYWKKLSDMEVKYGSVERGLGILLEGARCIPACSELWTAALQALRAFVKEHDYSEDVVSSAVDESVDCVGLSYRSVEVWDYCIEYYTSREDLPKLVEIYRRLLSTPTKQYNKHWDRFLALVREYHPRSLLHPEEYEALRHACCKQLGLKYTPGPLVPPPAIRKTAQPEDKVSAAIKEKLVASLVPIHEANEKAVDKRWKFEERIKRPYFHIKTLDRRQLKNWHEYIEMECREGDPHRVLLLFERCLVSCAQYEEFWCHYAEYLEEHVGKIKAGVYADKLRKSTDNVDGSSSYNGNTTNTTTSTGGSVGDESNKSNTCSSGAADSAVAAALADAAATATVDNCEGPSEVSKNLKDDEGIVASDSDKVNLSSVTDCNSVQIKSEPLDDDDIVLINASGTNPSQITDSGSNSVYLRSVLGGDRKCWTYQDVRGYVSTGVALVGRVLRCPALTKEWVYSSADWEDVRQVYRRAAWIHCPDKPLIMLQWAVFEEIQGDVTAARDLLSKVAAKYPTLLSARLAQVELEQRAGEYERAELLYKDALGAVTAVRDRSFLSILYARFLFKIRDNFDQALALLRKALRKDKGNVFLYQHVFDLCYNKRPMDTQGVLAAVSLALQAKDLSSSEKCSFALKKVAFLREHGTLQLVREARTELKKFEKLHEQNVKEENDRLEKEAAEKKKEGAENAKAMQSESKKDDENSTAAKPCNEPEQSTHQQPLIQQHFPSPYLATDGGVSYGHKETLSFTPPVDSLPQPHSAYSRVPPPIWQPGTTMTAEEIEMEQREQMAKNREYEEMIRNRPPPAQGGSLLSHLSEGRQLMHGSNPPPSLHFQPRQPPFTAPPVQLSNPGAGLKRPFPMEFSGQPGNDPKHSRLEIKQPCAPQFDPHYTEHSGPAAPPNHRATLGAYSDGPLPFGRPPGLLSLVKPDAPQVLAPGQNGLPPASITPSSDQPRLPSDMPEFNTPQQAPGAPQYTAAGRNEGPVTDTSSIMRVVRPPSTVQSDTVNVPEWLVKEGGELRLSTTNNGNSVIRYWPSYMTLEGSQKMFQVIRKNIKWYHRRMLVDGEGVHVPHLLSWVGPCDYSYHGMTLIKNDNWRPEIVDLLHRLMQYTNAQYNSCYLSLYRHGNDRSIWACHDHPALRERPVIAIVSLGQTRSFEMQRKDGRGFLRFPLFPGSLLLMEGATQDDWLQQIPKEPLIAEERIELAFRKMYMIKGLTV